MERVVILGGGESGLGAAVLAKQKGYNVWLSDNGAISQASKDVLLHHQIDWEEGGHSMPEILNAQWVVKSPGIPEGVPVVQAAIKAGIPVISEIEWASKFTDARIVGITGTNGKTTTASLTHFILKQELEVALAGNIGDGFAYAVAKSPQPNYVLELSSFQLDGIVKFKPHIAAIINITPDHLDRYNNDFEQYVAAKFRIAMNQGPEDYLIYDADDPVITAHLENHPVRSKLMPFSLEKTLEEGAYIENETIIIKHLNNPIQMPIATLGLQGKNNT